MRIVAGFLILVAALLLGFGPPASVAVTWSAKDTTAIHSIRFTLTRPVRLLPFTRYGTRLALVNHEHQIPLGTLWDRFLYRTTTKSTTTTTDTTYTTCPPRFLSIRCLSPADASSSLQSAEPAPLAYYMRTMYQRTRHAYGAHKFALGIVRDTARWWNGRRKLRSVEYAWWIQLLPKGRERPVPVGSYQLRVQLVRERWPFADTVLVESERWLTTGGEEQEGSIVPVVVHVK